VSWYSKIIVAQVWDVGTDGSFIDELNRVYELEYKRSMIINNEFQGMEERKYNIIQKLEDELWEAIGNVKGTLLSVFSTWLKSHALTNPEQWAQARFDGLDEKFGEEMYGEGGEEQILQSTISEYMEYKNPGGNKFDPYHRGPSLETGFSQIIQEMSSSPEMFPSLQPIQDLYIEGEREYLYNAASSDVDEINDRFNTEFEDTDTDGAMEFIENVDLSDLDISDYIYGTDMESFIRLMQQAGVSLGQFVTEINQNLIFPLWYGKWSQEGIDDTRAIVEDIYKRLQTDTRDIGQELASVNIAINTTHQTGDMLDYLEDYSEAGEYSDPKEIKQVMTQLSEGRSVPRWNKELREVGVKFKRQRKVK
tara:strand:+ start:17301 stop:18392 length:1092 start_codon:yes stop_codon:yes gene_type:complete